MIDYLLRTFVLDDAWKIYFYISNQDRRYKLLVEIKMNVEIDLC